MPLIVEYETLTMARMAQAAGIDEADLLAVSPTRTRSSRLAYPW
jgi:hypothetical protein